MPDELQDDALVVRGGRMENLSLLQQRAEDEFEDSGRYGLSTFCGILEDQEGIEEFLYRLVDGGASLPHSTVRITTAGELRQRGFDIEQDDPPACHFNVWIGDKSISAVEQFRDAFEPPMPNPVSEEF